MKDFLKKLFPIAMVLSFCFNFLLFAGEDSVTSYDQLLQGIRELRESSLPQESVPQHKVREAWGTGRLIKEYLARNWADANFREELLKRLITDAKINDTTLRYELEFAEEYPGRPIRPLSWSQYQALLSLNDPAEREAVEKKADENHWTIERLRAETVKRNQVRNKIKKKFEAEAFEKSKTAPAHLNVYRVVKAAAGPDQGKRVLDLGFLNYFRAEDIGTLKENDLVFFENGRMKISEATKEGLHTYHAVVTKILDGDTFDARVELGFNFSTEQRVRLKWVNAPEIGTPGAMEARQFLVNQMIQSDGKIVMRVLGHDKYNRFLAEVWVNGKSLNHELLDHGLAAFDGG